MLKVSKKQFITSAIWKILEQFLSKGVSLIISIFLARLLTPDDFGLIALTAVFTNLSDILIDGGFSTALISKENVEDSDYAGAFVVNIGTSILLYIILFFTAPVISNFYGEPQLTLLLRIIGLMFFIQAFSATRTAIVTRNMQFKFLFYCNLISTILSGVIGVLAAYFGLGVWAIVLQRLLQMGLTTILLFIKIRWKFKFVFVWKRVKGLLAFSCGVLLASLINYAGTTLYSLVIGKVFSVTDLGYYDKGPQLPMMIALYIFGAISSVLLPTLVSYQQDAEGFKSIVRKVIKIMGYLIFPMMIGLAFTSQEIVSVIFTDKWLPMVRIMQYSCLYYLATPFMLINVQVFLAKGHSLTRVFTEVCRFVLLTAGMGIFCFMLKCNINQLTLVSAVVAVLSTIITACFMPKYTNYRLKEMIADIFLPFISACMMGGIVLVADILWAYMAVNLTILKLIVKIVLGMGSYWLFSAIFKISGYCEMKTLLLQKFKRHEKAHEQVLAGEKTEQTVCSTAANVIADIPDEVSLSVESAERHDLQSDEEIAKTEGGCSDE